MQDKIRLGPLLVSAGLRFDRYSLLARGSQAQPRVGVANNIRRTGTVVRASYNRNYQTPVNENLLLQSSERATVLVPPEVREALGGALILIKPERQNFIEVGAQQVLAPKLSLNAVYFRKDIWDLHDNDNFFNTGIIFPTSLARARVRGAEGRINLAEYKNLAGSISFTHYDVLVRPPFTGGLFIGGGAIGLLNSGPFVMDHDQVLGMHGMLTWHPRRSVSGMIVCGEGELIKTFLLPGKSPKGERVA